MTDRTHNRPIKKPRNSVPAATANTNPLIKYHHQLQLYVCQICDTELQNTNDWSTHVKAQMHIDGINALKHKLQQLKSNQSIDSTLNNNNMDHTTSSHGDSDGSSDINETNGSSLPAGFFDNESGQPDTLQSSANNNQSIKSDSNIYNNNNNYNKNNTVNDNDDEIIDIVDDDIEHNTKTINQHKQYNINDNDISIDFNNTLPLSNKIQQSISEQALRAYEDELKSIELQQHAEYNKMSATLELGRQHEEQQTQQLLKQRIIQLKNKAAQARQHKIIT